MKPIHKVDEPPMNMPGIEKVEQVSAADLDAVLEAQQNLAETHELLCEPACSSELENDLFLEL